MAVITVFPHIRPTGIIILCSLQIRVLLENSIFLLHKVTGKDGIGGAPAHWESMNSSANKQTVPEMSESGAASILNENVSIRL